MLIIMNSAMMPIDGTYTKKTISSNEAKKLFLKYKNDYISYISYPNSCKVLSQLFNKRRRYYTCYAIKLSHYGYKFKIY